MIDKYCPEPLKAYIRSSESNQDCLIRLYLGRRRRVVRQSKFNAFGLRNFPLHIDQIEELALDAALYTRILAETLADLYWRAHVDANDVEFVLAPPRKEQVSSSAEPSERQPHHSPITLNSPILGEHAVWILDFDCCKDMSLDESGVKQAVAAFYRNDPYFPRPGRSDPKDQLLWNDLRIAFLRLVRSYWIKDYQKLGCLRYG